MAKKKPTRPKPATSIAGVQAERIEKVIHVIRGERVMLDSDIAKLYGVEVRALNQQVRRNEDRFPPDFIFQLTDAEWQALRSQFVTLDAGRGRHRKYMPHAFTQNGVAMLCSVLRSPRAVPVNIEIMRAFVRMRRLLATPVIPVARSHHKTTNGLPAASLCRCMISQKGCVIERRA